MRKISITDIQRNIGDLSMALIRGEEIIITRNGKDLAKLVPVEPEHPKPHSFGDTVVKPFSPKPFKTQPTSGIDAAIAANRCEAPFASCKLDAKLYMIEFIGEEGLQKEKKFLCGEHAKKARATCESVMPLST
jgi:prevent-host-death family protein